MDVPTSTIQSDFDRIALLADEGWNHNNHYHKFLLRRLPERCDNVLEIGCGSGEFARLLALRANRVVALDLSPNMIAVAKAQSANCTNIEYQVADALVWEYPANTFDCIVSIATLHHLPFEQIVPKLKNALRENGKLLVLDLFQAEGLRDFLVDMVAVPAHALIKAVKREQIRKAAEQKEAWMEHAEHDRYLTLSQVRRASARILPGAHIRRHLFWRYSLVWTKPQITS